jgi:glycerol-3-phosphate cytidylyltransferase
MMIIYTGGTFDLFHLGHLELLRKLASLGSVTVGLNTDEFITEYKGAPPIMNYEEREAVLLGCKYVSAVIPNIGGTDSKPSILQSGADVVAIGSDWARRDYYSQMNFTQDWLDEQGIWLLYVPYTSGVSSTDVKARIKKRLAGD